MDDLAAAVRTVADIGTVVAMTGAGVSTPSGIPDFRGPGGLWERINPGGFHIVGFQLDPAAFWYRWVELQDEVFADGAPSPNPAHEALDSLEAAGPRTLCGRPSGRRLKLMAKGTDTIDN